MTTDIENRVKELEAQVAALSGKKLGVEKIHAMLLVDESGSMSSCYDQTIAGMNEYIRTLEADSLHKYTLTIAKFDSAGTRYICENMPISEVPTVSRDNYKPSGGTPLYDAVGMAVQSAEKMDNDETDIIMVIITDGGENSSKYFTAEQVSTMVRNKQDNHNWTVVYLGANQDAWNVGQSLGTNYAFNYNTSNIGSVFAASAGSNVADATSRTFTGVRLDAASYQKNIDEANK